MNDHSTHDEADLVDDDAHARHRPDTVGRSDAPTRSDTDHDTLPSTAHVLGRGLLGLVALIVGLSAIGLVGRLVAFDGVIGDADSDVVRWTADRRTDVLDTVFSTGSTLSDTWTIIGVVVGAVTMLLATGRGRHAATILLAVAIEFTTFLVVGAVVDRPRPDVEALNSVPSTPSFPSGHVAAAFVLYGSLVLVARSISSRSLPRSLWLAPLFLALVVAASRVYEGLHHPIDVAAGLLLGIGAVVAAGHATGIVTIRATSD